MPVKIKELYIKVNVEASGERPSATDRTGRDDQEAIVSACVEKVLEVLEQKKQR